MSSSSSSLAGSPRAGSVWEWSTDGRLAAYPEKTNKLINQELAQGRERLTGVNVGRKKKGGAKFTIDTKAMVQINERTGCSG